MSQIKESSLELIGGTPILKLNVTQRKQELRMLQFWQSLNT